MTREYQRILSIELSKRLKSNPLFSQRAFARVLGISPSALSEIISGRRGISVKKAESLLEKLDLSYDRRVQFMNSVKQTKAKFRKKGDLLKDHFYEIDEEVFSIISDWKYYAILNLLKLDSFKLDVGWISKKLGLRRAEVSSAIACLERVGLIKKEVKGLVRTKRFLKVSDDIKSSALRRHHKQMIQKAYESIEKHDLEIRDITSITFPTCQEKVREAKGKIKRFRRNLAKFLESGRKDDVYNLNIQLIPLTEVKKGVLK